MTGRPLLSMVMIARDEAHNIQRCFDSWWDDVDEVIVCDTGSSDATIARANAYARKHGRPGKLKVTRVPWGDDFAAARNHADQAASGQWLAWCDLDDTVLGLGAVRDQLEGLPDATVALTAIYEYAVDGHGNVFSQLWRERLIRAGHGQWEGRIHEVKYLQGDDGFVQLPPAVARWVHHRDHSGVRPQRNVRLLEAWREREPDNARCLLYLGMELMGLRRFTDATGVLRVYLQIAGEHLDVRAQATRMLCMCLGANVPPQWQEMRKVCGPALVENPGWPDTYLTLAEIANDRGDFAVALRWADIVIDIGIPQTALVINPTQYTIHPRMLKSTALWGLGRHDEALTLVREVMAASPDYLGMGKLAEAWEGHVGALAVVRQILQVSHLLQERGEPAKALALLDCAPGAIIDHPALTARRVTLERQLATGPVFPLLGPEGPVTDELVRALITLVA